MLLTNRSPLDIFENCGQLVKKRLANGLQAQPEQLHELIHLTRVAIKKQENMHLLKNRETTLANLTVHFSYKGDQVVQIKDLQAVNSGLDCSPDQVAPSSVH